MKKRHDRNRRSQDIAPNVLACSAGGAKEHSPERSEAKQVRRRFDYGGAFRRPWSGASSILIDKPGVPLRFTPGSGPPHPPGAQLNRRPK